MMECVCVCVCVCEMQESKLCDRQTDPATTHTFCPTQLHSTPQWSRTSLKLALSVNSTRLSKASSTCLLEQTARCGMRRRRASVRVFSTHVAFTDAKDSRMVGVLRDCLLSPGHLSDAMSKIFTFLSAMRSFNEVTDCVGAFDEDNVRELCENNHFFTQHLSFSKHSPHH